MMTTETMKVWEEMRAVLPEEVTRDWGHFVEIFGRSFMFVLVLFILKPFSFFDFSFVIITWDMYHYVDIFRMFF